MKTNPNLKADLFVFGILIFMMGMAFSVFVLEKDPEARLGLFGISVWVLVIVAAIYARIRRNKSELDKDDEKSETKDQT